MFALTEITSWHWSGFVVAVMAFLALDLGLFHRRAHVVQFKEALVWTFVWFSVAMLFGVLLTVWRGKEESLEFVTGYIIELSLSMDNVFVIALIFAYFRVPLQFQHRVLFWGIMGALLMRGVMIGVGAALIHRFQWLLYVLGGFLVITGIKMIFASEDGVDPEKNPVLRITRKLLPISPNLEGQKFLTRAAGRIALTPLAVVLVMVETTDLLFAVDSIPAIFSVTQKPFIVFTSNVFAILGLRSLYFVLANAIGYFRFLKIGLSFVLVFIGGKMLLAKYFFIPTTISLCVVGVIIIAAVLSSIVIGRRDKDKQTSDPP
ncbi:MAG: TerC family protein [Verrucomicrobiota bacterium]